MKWGFGSGLLVCARCKRTVAKTYTECPFCGAPTGEKPPPGEEPSGPTPASSPGVVEPTPLPAPEVFAPTASSAPEVIAPAAASAEPAFELDFGNVPPPPQHHEAEASIDLEESPPAAEAPLAAEAPAGAWGAIDQAPVKGDPLLGANPGLTPELADDVVALEANAMPPPEPSRAPPDEKPAVVPGAPSAAPMNLGPESAWRAPAPPRNLGEALGISIPAAPGARGSGFAGRLNEARKKRHPLVWSGAALLALSVLPLGCGLLVSGTDRDVEVEKLGSLGKSSNVRVIEGFASSNDRLELDPSEPIPLKNPYEIVSRPELKGRTVEVVAQPLSLAILKRYRVGPNGQRVEIDALTNVYAPITLDQRVWVVSTPVKASTPSDPSVTAFGSQRTYRGVVQNLSGTVSLDLLRQARQEGPELKAMVTKRDIPNEALAIVAYTGSTGPRMVAAPIMGTERKVWAMTTAEQISERELFGDYYPCPNEKCQLIESAAPTPPLGVLLVRENVVGALASTVRKAGALLFLLGIALTGAGLVLDRARRG